MNKKIIISILIFGIIFIGGCVSQGNINSFVQTLPQVEKFLNEHPNAEIKAVLWNEELVESNIDIIKEAQS